MDSVIFNYEALADAQSRAKTVVNGWGCMVGYREGILGKLSTPLDEGTLSAEEPYGHTHVSSAQTCVANKQEDLETKGEQWIHLSDNLGSFLQYLKDTEDNVVNIFSTTSSAYVDYSGVGGFFYRIGDFFYNGISVDLANSNWVTRGIFDFGKSVSDDLLSCKRDAEDHFKHGEGKYVLNIVGSSALALAAVAGAILSFATLPFSGGATCSTAMACISIIGATATSISAAITTFNAASQVTGNVVALSTEDDPATARFYGDITKLSEAVEKNDLGSSEANEDAAYIASAMNKIQVGADFVAVGSGIATTFGKNTINIADAVGKKAVGLDKSLRPKTITAADTVGDIETYSSFTRNVGDIKVNVLKAFGVNAVKSSMTIDETNIAKDATIINVDDLTAPTLEMTWEGGQEATYKLSTLDKTAKTLTVDEANIHTEYASLVASNGIVTQEMSAYRTHAAATTKVFDYTNAVSSARTVAAAKAVNDSNLKISL